MSNPIQEALEEAQAVGIQAKVFVEPNRWGILRSVRFIAPYGFTFGEMHSKLFFLCHLDSKSDESFANDIGKAVAQLMECKGLHDLTLTQGCGECNSVENL
jgi:hypothetical protein